MIREKERTEGEGRKSYLLWLLKLISHNMLVYIDQEASYNDIDILLENHLRFDFHIHAEKNTINKTFTFMQVALHTLNNPCLLAIFSLDFVFIRLLIIFRKLFSFTSAKLVVQTCIYVPMRCVLFSICIDTFFFRMLFWSVYLVLLID